MRGKACLKQACLNYMLERCEQNYIQYHLQKILQETQKLACQMQNIL